MSCYNTDQDKAIAMVESIEIDIATNLRSLLSSPLQPAKHIGKLSLNVSMLADTNEVTRTMPQAVINISRPTFFIRNFPSRLIG